MKLKKETYAFISYSSKNQQTADSIRMLFIDESIPCWMAPYDIPVGTNYGAIINDALENCACFVLLLTNASQKSTFVGRELERAVSYGKTVIPIQLENVVLSSEFKFFIGGSQITAVPSVEANAREIKKVIAGIKSCLSICASENDEPTEAKAAVPFTQDEPDNANLRAAAPQVAKERYKNRPNIDQKSETAERLERLVRYAKRGDEERELGNPQAAKEQYEKGLGFRERVVRVSGTAQMWWKLSVRYNRLGDIERALGNPQKAKEWYEKALNIIEKLARETGTGQPRWDLSVIYTNLGDTERDLYDREVAKEWYEKALYIREKLVRKTGTAQARRDLSVSYERLGGLESDQGNLQAAKGWHEKALSIREKLVLETGTAKARRDLSLIYTNLGNTERALGNPQAAKGWYEKALSIDKELARETDTVEAWRDLSVIYINLGDIEYALVNLLVAKDRYEKALSICRKLVLETGTAQARWDLSVSYQRLGRVAPNLLGDSQRANVWVWLNRDTVAEGINYGNEARNQGDMRGAKIEFESALYSAKESVEETGQEVDKRYLSILYHHLGGLERDQGNLQAAKGWYEKALSIDKELAQETGTLIARGNLAWSYDKLSDVSCDLGDLQAAEEYLTKGYAIAEQLCKLEPQDNRCTILYDTLAQKQKKLKKIKNPKILRLFCD